MKEEARQNILNSLVSEKSLKTTLSRKIKEFIFESIPNELIPQYEANGWKICKQYKTTVKMQKQKPLDYNRQIHLYSFFNSDVQKMFFWPIKKHLKIV